MMPHEFGDAPAPAQYFMEAAFYSQLADRAERRSEMDAPNAGQAQDLLDQYQY